MEKQNPVYIVSPSRPSQLGRENRSKQQTTTQIDTIDSRRCWFTRLCIKYNNIQQRTPRSAHSFIHVWLQPAVCITLFFSFLFFLFHIFPFRFVCAEEESVSPKVLFYLSHSLSCLSFSSCFIYRAMHAVSSAKLRIM